MTTIIAAALPEIIALIRAKTTAAGSGGPAPTDAEVIAALHTAVAEVLAKGDAWKAEHPAS